MKTLFTSKFDLKFKEGTSNSATRGVQLCLILKLLEFLKCRAGEG